MGVTSTLERPLSVDELQEMWALGVTDNDEYGNPIASSEPAIDGLGYGWLGAKQRATTNTGLLLMGARVYNPVTGMFTSTDPVFGGGATAYAYPTDPVNQFDLDGQKWWKRAWGWAKRNKMNIALTAAGFVPGLGAAAWAYRGYRTYRAVRAVSASSKVCRANSFEVGTLVSLDGESAARIEDIEVGDEVLAEDPEGDAQAQEEVTDVIRGAGPKNLVLIGVDPNSDGKVSQIVATDGHPFWVHDLGWVDAKDLAVGDQLESAADKRIEVMTINRARRLATVYNLTVTRLHSYFVVAEGVPVLVHNAGCGHTLGGARWMKNSGNLYSSMSKAVQAAKRYAGSKKSCVYRGVCSRGNHVHVDRYIGGRLVHTRHYYWKG